MSRVAHQLDLGKRFFPDRLSKVAQTPWRWRAVAAAGMLLAGFGVHEIAIRAPLAERVAVAASQVPVTVGAPIDAQAAPNRSEALGSQHPQGFAEALSPYAADHLDAQFVDYSHFEPLSPESVRDMALTQFLGLSSAEPERHARR
jgi:hypothetical protein